MSSAEVSGADIHSAAPPVRAAFHAAGEKHFLLARVLYRWVLGPHWRDAILGFSYLKGVDNRADGEPDARRALAFLQAQRGLLGRAYAGESPPGGLSDVEQCGYAAARADSSRGAPQRRWLEHVLGVIEHDVRRRHQLWDETELERWAGEAGRGLIHAIWGFVGRGRDGLSDGCAEWSSRAYMLADVIVDLEQDLPFGIFNVPAELIERLDIRLELGDPGLDRWVIEYTARVEAHFERALTELARIRSARMRLLGNLLLRRKRWEMRRFAQRRGAASLDAARERIRPASGLGGRFPRAS